jgi:predicted ATPase
VSSNIFVGRRAQRAELNRHWRGVLQSRQGKIIFLTGEAGIGKSALIRQFSHDVQANYSGIQVAYTQCDQIAGDISPYAPFVLLLNSLLEQAVDQADQSDNWFVAYMQEVGPDVLKMVPVAGELLAAAAKSVEFIWDRYHREDELPNQFGQKVLFQQFTDAFCKLARHQNPLLLCIDDWHWADTSSTNLLFHIARSLNEVPLMIVAAYRPEDARACDHPILKVHNQIKRYNLCAELGLDFLSQTEIEAYLAGRFPQTSFEPEFVDRLLAITSGNALFVTEFVNLLVQEERLSQAGRPVIDLQQLSLPPNVEAVIRSRIEHLHESAQKILAYASVEGDRFTAFLLSQLLEMDLVTLLSELNRIAERYQLIVKLEEQVVYQQQTTVYWFKHSLIRRALSATIGQQGQVEISRRIVRLLGDIYNRADRANQGQLVPDLVQHAANARDYASQVRYALVAAKEAATNYALTEVIKYCQLILTVVDREALSPARKTPAYFYLGHAHRELGRYDQAVASYTEVITHRRNYYRVYQHRGRVYFDWKKYDLALADYDQAIKLEPASATSFYLRALLYHRQNQKDAALADFTHAIELDPDHFASYRERGRIYAERKRFREAIADYTRALEAKPTSARTYLLRANLHRRLEQYDQAIADFTEATALKPNYYLAYRDRGRVYVAIEAYCEGITDFTRAIALRPDLAFPLVLRGIAYRHQKKFSAALADFNQALEINADYYRALLERGQVFLLQRNYEQALTDFGRAVNLKDDRPEAYLGRGDAQRHLGQFTTARTDYRHARELTKNRVLRTGIEDRLEQLDQEQSQA